MLKFTSNILATSVGETTQVAPGGCCCCCSTTCCFSVSVNGNSTGGSTSGIAPAPAS
ncbi:streptolysin S family TOMM toxin [Streptococcus ictaluri]|uniref:streptolysin S family TOMM toxin n=1 Tax=Streptococcus ictaluri TaxID=380397 RepID=UPI0009FBEB1F|nr:streptolysin S family TOMM toxin [Streptococcus ictaluri]